MKKTFYITTPIYYVNAAPHLGTLYSTIIADVAKRYQALLGKETFFMTGTDEHGQKIADVAALAKQTPQAFVDSMIEPFKTVWKAFDIQYDHFIRTTDPLHITFVQNAVKTLLDQGDIYKAEYEGLYCIPCESFVTLSEQTTDALCPIHQKPLSKISEESYFFRLSAYEEQLLTFYKEHPDFITPKERYAEIISFVKSGLKDLSISRTSVSWGIPFPGDEKHTIYVWVDALLNYMSGLAYAPKNQDWLPIDTQVMAKDIVRFHAVYWPALLMALQKPLPQKLVVHGYLLMQDQKMSKSLGNSLRPELLANIYGTEQIRYYLMKQIPFHQDGQCSLDELVAITNADLSNTIGNLLQRTISLIHNRKITTVQPPEIYEPAAISIHKKAQETISSYTEFMNHYQFHKALHAVMEFASATNGYLHTQEPWKLQEHQNELFQEIMTTTLHALDCIGLLLTPFLPKKMAELRQTLGKNSLHVLEEKNQFSSARNTAWTDSFTPHTRNTPLFPRIEIEKQNQPAPTSIENTEPTISIEDFAKITMVTGTILAVTPVAKSEKLLQLTVDLGSYGIRTILSGVAQSCSPESLLNTQGLFIVNLPERKMAGIVSQGMMLFGKATDGRLIPSSMQEKVPNGTRIG